MDMFIQRNVRTLCNIRNAFVNNLDQCLIHLRKKLFVLLLFLLVFQNEHFLHSHQGDDVTGFPVEANAFTDDDDFSMFRMLCNNYIII
ncbi:hypothetical protein D3C76_1612550 [compost metagenome]